MLSFLSIRLCCYYLFIIAILCLDTPVFAIAYCYLYFFSA